MSLPTASPPLLRIRRPGDLLEMIPYLVGFRPVESLVLLGLHERRLVVTARLDLGSAEQPAVVDDAVRMTAAGGASSLIAAVYRELPDDARPDDAMRNVRPAPVAAVTVVAAAAEGRRLTLTDALLVSGARWWSYLCDDDSCCAPEGEPLPGDTSECAAAATYAGLVALPDRADLEGVLAAAPDDQRAGLYAALDHAEEEQLHEILDGRVERYRRSVKRAIFAAAREADRGLFVTGTASTRLCRFAVGLADMVVRDAVWLAVDERKLDGRRLWQELACRLPAPYDAAPAFLFGWATWREGNGTLAGIAADRALASDPDYHAAQLLRSAVASGLNPHRVPRLRSHGTA